MPKLGLDAQKLDTRPNTPGNAAMDAEAQYSFGGVDGKSSEARGKDSRLNLGGLTACPRSDDRDGNVAKRAVRSQPRP